MVRLPKHHFDFTLSVYFLVVLGTVWHAGVIYGPLKIM